MKCFKFRNYAVSTITFGSVKELSKVKSNFLKLELLSQSPSPSSCPCQQGTWGDTKFTWAIH